MSLLRPVGEGKWTRARASALAGDRETGGERAISDVFEGERPSPGEYMRERNSIGQYGEYWMNPADESANAACG